VDVVDALGTLAVGEQGVEDHDGDAVHDEADMAPEGMEQPLGEIGERLREQVARERDIIHVFQSQNSGRCYQYFWGDQRGHIQEGHDGAQNRRRWPYGHGLEEDLEPDFGAGVG